MRTVPRLLQLLIPLSSQALALPDCATAGLIGSHGNAAGSTGGHMPPLCHRASCRESRARVARVCHLAQPPTALVFETPFLRACFTLFCVWVPFSPSSPLLAGLWDTR